MIAILTVGSYSFAFKKAANATKVLELLSDAEPVESKYRAEVHGYIYFPAAPQRRHWQRVSIEMTPESSLVAREPADDEPLPTAPPPRRRGLQLPPSA